MRELFSQRSASEEDLLLSALLLAICLHELLLQVRLDSLVASKLHGKLSLALRLRPELAAVPEHVGQRYLQGKVGQ